MATIRALAANAQIEQDLIICRTLVEIFREPQLASHLAFRGGTALFKLYLSPFRYSEDIDLVQTAPGPIGHIMNTLQQKLNPWLGNPKRKQSEGRVTLTYRMESEDALPLKLKIEINSREHFAIMGYKKQTFRVNSRWFSGSASIITYELDELLGTKVRALYQRKKGRDLFDLWAAFNTAAVRPERVVKCFLHYMENEGHKVSRAEFEQNVSGKFNDPGFIKDIEPLILADSGYTFQKTISFVMSELAPLIPGEPWRGK
jgi:predicted nucleotidyltransferase component of viral defense system